MISLQANCEDPSLQPAWVHSTYSYEDTKPMVVRSAAVRTASSVRALHFNSLTNLSK